MTSVNDEGWNQVRRKNGRKRNRAEPRQPTGIGPNPSPELSIDDIREYHNGIARDWLASDSWQALLGILMTATSPQRRPLPICKAICLGPGPFDPANGSTAIRRTAHIQTAAFVSIVSALETQLGQKIRCIIQEPGFTDVDKQFCQDDLGFLVVDTPEAFSMVDENTLVFGIHMELQTYSQALRTTSSLPTVFIGAGLDEWDKLMDVDPELPGLKAIREMDRTYDKFSFPDMNYMFHGTTIYWKKAGDPPSELAAMDDG